MAPGPAWTLSSPAAPFGSGGVAVGHPPGALGSAAAHSFGLGGAAFAPVAPPDILDLDAWMDREKWHLGRLTDHQPGPVSACQRLDDLITQEVTSGRSIEQIISIGGSSAWRVISRVDGTSEIHMPSQAWQEILSTWFAHHQTTTSATASTFRGIPVIELPF